MPSTPFLVYLLEREFPFVGAHVILLSVAFIGAHMILLSV
jgi:hypothetical protein